VVRRAAFTLIELIIAIVIIGIAFMSLPTLTQTSMDSIESNIAQEAIFAASAKMAQVLTYSWDENAINPAQPLSTGKVVDTNSTASLMRNGTTSFRLGHVLADNHRRMHPVNTPASAVLGADVGDVVNDDIDDFTGLTTDLFTDTTTTATGYKQNYQIQVLVNYVDDSNGINFNGANPFGANVFPFETAASGTSNLKMVTLLVNNVDTGEEIVRMRSYAANVGEIDYHKRRFP